MKGRKTKTNIIGNINGVTFEGEGEGYIDYEKGVSEGKIKFSNFPLNFSPLLCRSWKCKHHPCVPPKEKINFKIFPSRDYDIREVMIYKGDCEGKIEIKGKVREIEHNLTEAFSNFYGVYSGPTEIEEIEIFRESFIHLKENIYHITGYRKVRLKDERKKLCESFWYGNLELKENKKIENPISFIQNYKILEGKWDGKNLEKKLSIIKSLEIPFEVKILEEKYYESAYNFYFEIEKERLEKIGYKIKEVPHFSKDFFKEIRSPKGLLIGVYEEEKIVGLSLITFEENDDLIKGKYVDILFFGILTEYKGLGIETLMFKKIIEESKNLPLRTTTYTKSEEEKILFETFGFNKLLERYELR